MGAAVQALKKGKSAAVDNIPVELVQAGGKNVITTLDGLQGEEAELAKLIKHLDKASTAYGIEISAEKTKS